MELGLVEMTDLSVKQQHSEDTTEHLTARVEAPEAAEIKASRLRSGALGEILSLSNP